MLGQVGEVVGGDAGGGAEGQSSARKTAGCGEHTLFKGLTTPLGLDAAVLQVVEPAVVFGSHGRLPPGRGAPEVG